MEIMTDELYKICIKVRFIRLFVSILYNNFIRFMT
jgi:hypothetical protein